MPELPEVETTRRGIEPYLEHRVIDAIEIREPRLRWPVPAAVQKACGQRVTAVERRAKYLLIRLESGALMLHLGMSGSVRVVPADHEVGKHDHVDLHIDNGHIIRFNDPRRFGSLLWLDGDGTNHPLLKNLGPEPLSEDFSGDYLWQSSRQRRIAIKSFIMNGHVVVGVGNIYASEALFRAGIHPLRAAGRISKLRYQWLASAIRDVLEAAIAQGGTTLRDFSGSDGQPGYFTQELAVYGREGLPCIQCQAPLRQKRIGQRASYYCINCQR
jgi:formamidopyrimidine-DNA glycosylase